MVKSTCRCAAGLALLLGLICLFAPSAQAQAKDEQAWYKTFNGHEMWSENIDSTVALSAKVNKPVLIDFWQRH